MDPLCLHRAMLVQHFTLAALAYPAFLVPAGATGMVQVSLHGTELSVTCAERGLAQTSFVSHLSQRTNSAS